VVITQGVRRQSADTQLTSFTLNPGMNLGAKVDTSSTELQAFVKDYIFFFVRFKFDLIIDT
jgi:hypothetical protein